MKGDWFIAKVIARGGTFTFFLLSFRKGKVKLFFLVGKESKIFLSHRKGKLTEFQIFLFSFTSFYFYFHFLSDFLNFFPYRTA